MSFSHFDGGLFFEASSRLPETMAENLRRKWQVAEDLLEDALAEAEEIAVPCAFLRPATVEQITETGAVIGGVPFAGSVFSARLAEGMQVFPYVMSCGRQLHDWMESYRDDVLMASMSAEIAQSYLGAVGAAVRKYVHETLITEGHVSALNPGSLEDGWSITGQRDLFALLGEGGARTGVTLTESCLMVPLKSGSGIWFPSESHYENCMLCPRTDCPNRRAPYDADGAECR